MVQAPFSVAFRDQFARIAAAVFGRVEPASLNWRLDHMPHVTVFTAEIDATVVAFKAGYAMTERRYYSWLGGVHPEHRRRGLASELMQAQHAWVSAQGYALIETHVRAANRAMVQTNRSSGLDVTGRFRKEGENYLMMQKPLG